jgi:general secretion pathway protein K
MWTRTSGAGFRPRGAFAPLSLQLSKLVMQSPGRTTSGAGFRPRGAFAPHPGGTEAPRGLKPAPRKTKAAGRRGSALLTVLWLSAALGAIALSLANTVRSETDRTSTGIDGLKGYYLAQGAIERCALELLWSIKLPQEKRPIPQGATHMQYSFPGGDVQVELIPETARLDINTTSVPVLFRLGIALGLEPERAQAIADGIELFRHPAEGMLPSFQRPDASFQEIEELLLVPGVTPEVFYGTYVPAEAESGGPRLVARPGLVDCLSVFGSRDRVDANTAPAAVLAAVGLTPFAINALLERRKLSPLTDGQLSEFMLSIGAPRDRLRVEGNSIVILRATARPRLPNGALSDLKRTVAARVKYMPDGYDSPIHILRWYDSAWSGN